MGTLGWTIVLNAFPAILEDLIRFTGLILLRLAVAIFRADLLARIGYRQRWSLVTALSIIRLTHVTPK